MVCGVEQSGSSSGSYPEGRGFKSRPRFQYLGVAQSGQSARFGSGKSVVQIHPPRPSLERGFLFMLHHIVTECVKGGVLPDRRVKDRRIEQPMLSTTSLYFWDAISFMNGDEAAVNRRPLRGSTRPHDRREA